MSSKSDTEAQAREVVEKISERLSIERVIAKDADWNRGYNEAVSDCIDAIKSEQMQVELTAALHSRFAAGVQACVEQMKALRNDWNTRYEQAGNLSTENHWFDKAAVADQIITALSVLAEAPVGEDVGLSWKDRHDTEQTMHNAWRKRAEEAEVALAQHQKVVRVLAGGMNTSCAACEALFGTRHGEQCFIAPLLTEIPARPTPSDSTPVGDQSSGVDTDGGEDAA